MTNPLFHQKIAERTPEPTTGDILEALLDFSGRMDEKFEGIDERFESIDQKFKKIDDRFERIDDRFEKIDKRFDIMDQRFDHIDNQLYEIRDEIRQIWHKLEDIDGRMASLEKTTIEDSNSQGKSIVDLEVRVKTLEKHVAF